MQAKVGHMGSNENNERGSSSYTTGSASTWFLLHHSVFK